MENNAKEAFFRKKSFYITAIVIILILGFSMYKLGYRIQSNLKVVKVGTVILDIPMPLTSIYIDQSKKITTSKDNEIIKLSFSPTNHSIIVSRDGYFPWKKDFIVPNGGELKLYPIFVSQNTTGQIITDKDSEYIKLKDEVKKNIVPKINSKLSSPDKSAEIWIENNSVMYKSGNVTTTVIAPETPVKNLDFYKNRSDVLIISTSNTIYAIEALKDGQQNFMPIYRGQDPYFKKTDPNFIYVLDGSNLMQVII